MSSPNLFSLGIEEIEDLKNDIQQALNFIK